MSKKEVIEQKTEELLTPIATAHGVVVYDVEYVKEGPDYYLRCFIDKEEGVTIDDCEAVSREMNGLLDKEDYIDEAYIFEVSSPGLGRLLKKDRHLEYSLGEEVELKLFKPMENSKEKEFTGILQSFDESTITIGVPVPKKEDTFEDMVFDRKNIAFIRLTLDF